MSKLLRMIIGLFLLTSISVMAKPSVSDDNGNCNDFCKKAKHVVATPEGLSLSFNYIAQAPFDIFDPAYIPAHNMLATPLFPGFLIGDGWQREVMGRDDLAIGANLNDALAFIADRFEIELADIEFEDPFGLVNPVTKPVRVAPFQVDPRTGATVHQMSGVNIPKEGIVLEDGGWTFQVIALDGYSGSMRSKTDPSIRQPVHYPAGTIFPFGDYKIVAVGDQVTRDGRPFAPRIHYQASEPILPDPNINFGRIGAGFILDPEASAIIRVDCELIADLGDGTLRPGRAIGTYKYTFEPDINEFRTNLREILTISDTELDKTSTFVPPSVFGDHL